MKQTNYRIAVIDVGTLKSKFEIREYTSNGTFRVLHKDKELTVLGRDLPKNDGLLLQIAIKTTIRALNKFHKQMQKFGVVLHRAVTTEAIRAAKNASQALARIKEETGIELDVLTHEDEAKMFFCHISKNFAGETIAVADIGGGSVQVVTGKDEIINYTHLFKTGTYFMQETFYATHHPKYEELKRARRYVSKEFRDLRARAPQVDRLIYGSTNIVEFMKATGVKLEPAHSKPPHEYQASLKELEKLFKKIIEKSYEDRMAMFSEEPYYMWSADNALINVFELLDIFQLDNVIPTNENISSGIFSELFEQASP